MAYRMDAPPKNRFSTRERVYGSIVARSQVRCLASMVTWPSVTAA
jgi:hypothetical protein